MLRAIDFKTNNLVTLTQEEDKLQLGKDKIQSYLEIGKEKYFYGFYESALKYYACVLKEDPTQVDAWIGQIRVLIDLEKIDAAVFWAEKGFNQFPEIKNMELVQAYALVYAGKIEKAKKLINKPVKKSELPMSWLLRGEVLLKMKLGFFHKFIKPYRGIGKIGAFFCFLKALESDPHDGFMNQRIGIAYLKANETAQAYNSLRVALVAAPQNPLTLYCLALCYRAIGDYDYALYHTKKAIAFNPELDAAAELLQWLHSPLRKTFHKLLKII